MESESRVDSYTMPLDAELAKAYLESHAIHVRLDGETLGGTAYALGPMMGGIRLYVEEHDERRARALLDDYHRALHERRRVSFGDDDIEDDEDGAVPGDISGYDAAVADLGAPASIRPQVTEQPQPETPDEMATHAWVASLAGLVLFPVFTHVYSVVCLLRTPRGNL